jgi:hypothetical protein
MTLYKIQSGDTLTALGKRFFHDPILGTGILANDNDITDPNSIRVGDTIKVRKMLDDGSIAGLSPDDLANIGDHIGEWFGKDGQYKQAKAQFAAAKAAYEDRIARARAIIAETTNIQNSGNGPVILSQKLYQEQQAAFATLGIEQVDVPLIHARVFDPADAYKYAPIEFSDEARAMMTPVHIRTVNEDLKLVDQDLHEYKSEVQEELVYKGENATKDGDTWAFRWYGLQSSLFAFFPGGVGDIALTVGGGPILGKVGGGLAELAPELPTLSRWLGADLGELPGMVRQIGSADIPAAELRPITYDQFARHVTDSGLSDAFSKPIADVYSDVYSVAKNLRPEPGMYLKPEFMAQHTELFSSGAARVDSTLTFDQRYKAAIEAGLPFGRPDAVFLSPASLIDDVFATGDSSLMEKTIGFPDGTFSQAGSMTRTYVDRPDMFGLRFARGSETGANQFWVPGGYTFNTAGGAGLPEMITNQLPSPLVNPFIRVLQ